MKKKRNKYKPEEKVIIPTLHEGHSRQAKRIACCNNEIIQGTTKTEPTIPLSPPAS